MKREDISYRVMPRKGAGCWVPGKAIKIKPGRVPTMSGPRWSGYHLQPTVRAKDKTKGANKKRSHDDSPWRASFSGGGGGFSSASVLARLASQDYYPDHEEEDEDDTCRDGDYHCGEEEDVVGVPAIEIRDGDGEVEEEDDDDGDDCMSFCDVGFVVDQIEGEDWCLVEEM